MIPQQGRPRYALDGRCDGCQESIPLTSTTQREDGNFCASCRLERRQRLFGTARLVARLDAVERERAEIVLTLANEAMPTMGVIAR